MNNTLKGMVFDSVEVDWGNDCIEVILGSGNASTSFLLNEKSAHSLKCALEIALKNLEYVEQTAIEL